MKKTGICAVLTLTEQFESLEDLTMKRPVASLPFAGRYRIIDFVLSSIAMAKIRSVALFIGRSGRSIYDHVRNGSPWGLDNRLNGGIFTFSQQFFKYQADAEFGFVDGYYEDLLTFLHRSNASDVFISGGNTIAPMDIRQIRELHHASGADVTTVIDETTGESLNRYVLSVEQMENIISRAIEEDIYMTATELVKYYLPFLEVNTYHHCCYTAIIDSLDAYYKANLDLLDTANYQRLFRGDIPILTKEKNGAPTFYTKTSQVQDCMIASDCLIRGKVTHSLLSRRVVVAQTAVVRDSVIMPGCKIAENAIVECAVIEKGVQIEPGQVVRGTPENPVVVTKEAFKFEPKLSVGV